MIKRRMKMTREQTRLKVNPSPQTMRGKSQMSNVILEFPISSGDGKCNESLEVPTESKEDKR